MPNLTENAELLRIGADSTWILLTGINILMMQLGFAAFESGATRAKHVKSVLFKNILDHAVGSLSWFFVGWGIFNGNDPFAGGNSDSFGNPPLAEYAKLFQQFGFAATSTTILSGAGRFFFVSFPFLTPES